MKVNGFLLTSLLGCSIATASSNRPLIHLTPEKGWMNDPNGLFYDRADDVWHAYYQFNPNSTVWAEPISWGHSISKDLSTWEEKGIAIASNDTNSGIYTGSVVIDRNNTSGFFNSSIANEKRIVAIYTYNTPTSETQEVAYSLDGGLTFKKYSGNPVININSTQFRDPKVFWYQPSQTWVMAVAQSQKYSVHFYNSKDLKKWTLVSEFKQHGILGYQYETPNLVQVPIVDSTNSTKTSKWVLFVSVNPGALIGGSFVQYFVGDFDGKQFTPVSNATQILDYGKDYYAFQIVDNTPSDEVIGMAWASNWQYCANVPTSPWRSSFSLARNFTLQYANTNPESEVLQLISTPIYNGLAKNGTSYHLQNQSLETNSSLTFDLSGASNFTTGLFDFELTFSSNSSAFGNADFAALDIYLKGVNTTEYLRLGFEGNAKAVYLDRSHTNVNFVERNPLFSGQVSVDIVPAETLSDTVSVYKIQGIVDRNILELYINDGQFVSTNTFFFSDGNYINTIDISTEVNKTFKLIDFQAAQYST
ncbi:beta-fructofuranosidase SUC2 SCDLUD_005325 [Saccharomycodes ludwigii]|uniref:beta-fructofuranosidase SUC2 n=1 Tax=Saccharomycodes ludwigii TaxID=36035 RepID=UPI001E84158C|nr:hypothetical protein SCDLUD_005325 [Saccharomycodes ludwigii]KAH3898978.1 hypothetical protein SCDLUD_005325 [Saccharomycodes ludwigii]